MGTTAGKLADSESSEAAAQRKIPSLWKAMFKTTSRRWKLEAGSLKKALRLSVKISWRREKSCEAQHDPWVLLVRTWAIWRKNLKITNFNMYQARTTSWVDHVWHRCGVYWVFVTPCWWFCERIVSTHCTAGHVKFWWTWQQRKGKETGARGWAMLSTLCKLRHNFSQEDLAMRFGVNQSTVSRLYSCWTKILESMHHVFPLWPDKTSIQESVPATFKNLYPDTRVIIDSAEIETDRSHNPILSLWRGLTTSIELSRAASFIHSQVHCNQ